VSLSGQAWGCEHDTGECDRGRDPGRGRRRGNPFLYAAGLMNHSALMSDFRTQSAGQILSPTRYNQILRSSQRGRTGRIGTGRKSQGRVKSSRNFETPTRPSCGRVRHSVAALAIGQSKDVTVFGARSQRSLTMTWLMRIDRSYSPDKGQPLRNPVREGLPTNGRSPVVAQQTPSFVILNHLSTTSTSGKSVTRIDIASTSGQHVQSLG
jgi:hypothetical protein